MLTNINHTHAGISLPATILLKIESMEKLSKDDIIAFCLAKGTITMSQAMKLAECYNFDDFESMLNDFIENNDPNTDGNSV